MHGHPPAPVLLWGHTRERSEKDSELDYILGVWRTKPLRYEVPASHPLKATFSREVGL